MLLKILKTYLPFLLGLAAGIYFITLSLTDVSFYYFPGDLGDARFNNYLLEHAHRFFTGQVDSFWNAPFMYPEENVITYSDNLLGSAPFYSVFRLSGYSRETSFQFWFILMAVLNYTACYFFLVYLFKNKYAAVLGAIIFAFSIALQSQMGHAQTFPRFAIPLALWMGVLYLKELKPIYFFYMVLFWVYQVYCGIYLGLLLFIPLGLFMISSCFFRWELYRLRFKSVRWWAWMTSAGIINILIILPLIIPYISRARQTGLYPYQFVIQSLPTPVSFFFSHPGNALWNFLNETGIKYPNFWDHQIFPGGIAWICMIVCCWILVSKLISKKYFSFYKVNPPVVLLFITGALTFILFIRHHNFSFYRIIYLVPGYGSLRALQRIMNIELFFYAIAVTFIFGFIFKKETLWSFCLFVFFVGVLIADNYVDPQSVQREELGASTKRIDLLSEKMKIYKAGSIISYEPDTINTKSIYYHLDAMLASQPLNLKTLNGYSATSPQGYNDYWMRPDKMSRTTWLYAKKMMTDSVIVIH